MKKIVVLLLFWVFFLSSCTKSPYLTDLDNLRFYFYSPKMLYNKAVDLYKSWDYEKADLYLDFTKCDPKDKSFCALKFYNKWDINYRMWEQKKDTREKLYYFEKALDYYNQSLKYKFDKDTVDNRDFVKKEINKLKEKQSQEKKEQSQEKKEQTKDNKQQENSSNLEKDSQTSSSWSNNEEKKSSNSQNQEKTSNQEKDEKWQSPVIKNGSMWLWWDKNDTSSLTEQDKQDLDNYYNSLKQEEKRNQSYFNKKNNSENESPFDSDLSPFRLFQNDPFFNENIDWWNNSNQKDW